MDLSGIKETKKGTYKNCKKTWILYKRLSKWEKTWGIKAEPKILIKEDVQIDSTTKKNNSKTKFI